jgi:predicted ribosome quality control (RQC) complex YloA/Tae2 family protein
MDAFLLSKSLDEFSARPGRKHVHSVYHVVPHVICLEFDDTANTMLFLSADPSSPGLWTSRRRRLRHSSTQTERMLEGHLESAELVAASSEDFERIAHFEFFAAGEFEETVSMTLVSEFTGRNSNIILKSGKDDTILACLRTVSRERNKYRELRKGAVYIPPPPLEKMRPDEINGDLLSQAVTRDDLESRLVSSVLGLSPALASEIASCMRDRTPEELQRCLFELLNPLIEGAVEPTIVYRGELPSRLLPFVPSNPEGEIRTFHSALEACRHFFEGRFERLHTEELRRRIESSLQVKKRKLSKAEESLIEAKKESLEAEKYESLGNLILMNIGEISRGDKSIEALDYSTDPPRKTTIELDPKLEPAKNAESYFKKAKKMRRAAKRVPKLLEETQEKLVEVEKLEQELERAQKSSELEELASRVIRRKPKPGEAPARKPYIAYRIQDQWDVLVGRSSLDNDTLTHRIAHAGDLWFHAYQAAGSHVILRCGGVKRQPDRSAIIMAAQLAAFHSKARTSTKVPVLYTEKRHVRKPRKSKPGLALAERFKTVMVEPKEAGKKTGG